MPHVACAHPSDLPAGTLERLSRGSFFASRGFLELWREVGGTPVAWVAEDAGRIAAVLAGVEFGHGPFARFVSMPDGCYGGLLADPALDGRRATAARALVEALARRRYACADVFDFYHTLAVHAGFERSRCLTRLVEIGGDRWAPRDRGLQAQIRRAARRSLQVERFDWERHQTSFLLLERATARRHGAPSRYPPAFFRALADLARRDDRVVWAWCEHAGHAVSSHIYFIERDTLQAWQTFFDKRFAFLRPNPCIRQAMCREAAARGVRWLNLGCTPAAAAGLARYKDRWGGRTVGYPRLHGAAGLGVVAGLLQGARR